MEMKYKSKSAEQTELIGKEFGAKLKKGDLVAFYGELGVGKTAFIKGIMLSLDLNAEVLSPTYSIVNEYRCEAKKLVVYHFDMYRIETFESLYSTGFFDYIDGNSIVLTEWTENIEAFLPDVNYKVSIKGMGEEERYISIETKI